LNFRAVLDDPARFGGDACRAAAVVGLVPREDSSAERRHKGRITKAGPSVLRSLLIQASWSLWRGALCRTLYAMWRDDVAFRGPAPAAACAR
jgi:transposase